MPALSVLPDRSRVYVPGCASVSTSTSDPTGLLNELVNRTLPYGSISRQRALAVAEPATTSKKKRSPAAAVKRYRSVSVAGLRLPLTGVPGVKATAEDSSLMRKA